jgi:hypothetical protein
MMLKMSAPETAPVSHPWIRRDLVGQLEELAAPDPRPLWKSEMKSGVASGIDEVIHFFFDDHDFDAGDIGYTLVDQQEAELLGDLKRALDGLVDALPRGNDDDYVAHPDWPNVTQAARRALERLRRS